MTAAFSFGPLGFMHELKVSAAPTLAREASLSRFTTAGGVAYFQRPRRAPRSWTVSRAWQDQTFIKYLERAAHGALPDVFLYDRAAAMRTMIPADLATGTGPEVLVEDHRLGSVMWNQIKVPILAGRTYTISAWTEEVGSPLEVSTDDTSFHELMPSADGRGQSQLTMIPTNDTMLVLSRQSQIVSGVRVNEGIPDGRFYAGQGTPCRVAVEIPEETYQLVMGRDSKIDYSVTLHETGVTGHYS